MGSDRTSRARFDDIRIEKDRAIAPQPLGIGGEAPSERPEIGQPAGIEFGVYSRGAFGLTARGGRWPVGSRCATMSACSGRNRAGVVDGCRVVYRGYC
jgi:hypothetical protein